jgi:hypothetical protein
MPTVGFLPFLIGGITGVTGPAGGRGGADSMWLVDLPHAVFGAAARIFAGCIVAQNVRLFLNERWARFSSGAVIGFHVLLPHTLWAWGDARRMYDYVMIADTGSECCPRWAALMGISVAILVCKPDPAPDLPNRQATIWKPVRWNG